MFEKNFNLIMDKYHSPLITTYSETQINYTAFDSLWIPCSAKFVSLGSTTSTEGVIQIYELCDGKVKIIKEKTHEKSFKCGTFGASSLTSRQLATGDFLGNLDIWDLESSIPVYSTKAHEDIIFCIDGIAGRVPHCGAPEIVTGSRDGLVKVWDPRQKDKPVAVMQSMDNTKRDCWAVTFGNSYNSQERVVCAGYDNGDIKLFDLKTMSLTWETNLPNGVCSLEFNNKYVKMCKFLATGLEDSINLFTRQNKAGEFSSITETAHKSTVWCGRHLPQNDNIFVTCGGSGSLCLWKYNYCYDDLSNEFGAMKILQKNTISSQCITSCDWSPDKAGLLVCTSMDNYIRLIVVSRLGEFVE